MQKKRNATMQLSWIDWTIVAAFFAASLVIGAAATRKAGRSAADFFAAGRAMPWWLLGISMVATTFSTDTPNLVTDLVRQKGVAGNWAWWAFLLTGLVTSFLFARLWKRSGVLTDIEFYEMRYGGKAAAFLRGFRAIYLGLVFNAIIMGSVTLAAIKIGGALLDLAPIETVIIAGTVTVIYSALGGLRGVLFTDLLQFVMAMAGAIGAAYYIVNMPEVGGLSSLLSHEAVAGKLSMLPTGEDRSELIALFLFPLAVQWWAMYYPGSEPGGGGYVAQRMLSAKSENHALGATFLFNAAHYALRPWPWILVALASLVVFPDLASLNAAFPELAAEGKVGHDLAYSAMMTFLPAGLLGLVVASLIAAYMSTISTHLNWGSSYLVNDVYKRFIVKSASDAHQVLVGRIMTVLLMVVAGVVAMKMESAASNFGIMLSMTAGMGLVYMLRWFWWRVNAVSEIVVLIVPSAFVLYFWLWHPGIEELLNLKLGWNLDPEAFAINDWQRMGLVALATTISWLVLTLLTRPVDTDTLVRFYKKTQPGGPGWRAFIAKAESEGHDFSEVDRIGQLPLGIMCTVLGCVAIYCALFATGYWLYGHTISASILTAVAVLSTLMLIVLWRRLTHPLNIKLRIEGKL
jgi:Na+/proline symporter